MIAPMLGKDKQIGIFTEQKQFLNEYLFQKSGWSSRDYRVCVSDLPENSAFNELVIFDKNEGDFTAIKKSIREMTRKHMEEYPNTGAIVLECQNFAPFGDLIQQESGVPVYGINQLVAFMEACINYKSYER